MHRMMGLPLICGGLLFLLLIAALVVLALWALRAYNRDAARRAASPGLTGGTGAGTLDQPGAPGSSRALEILRERYTHGEITKEQLDAMRQDILG